MNRIANVVALHYRDKWTWIYTPAILLISLFAVNLFISLLVPSDGKVYTGGLSSPFVYLLIIGIVMIVKTFPFAVGMSIRRIDFFIGSVAMGAITSFILSILIVVMAQLEGRNGWGDQLHFFNFPFINSGSLLDQFLIYMISFLFLFSIGIFIASFSKRFGGAGMLVGSLGTVLVGSVAVYLVHQLGLWRDIFSWFIGKTAVGIAFWLLPFIVIYLVFTFLFLRRANV